MVAIKSALLSVLPLLALDLVNARAVLNDRATTNGLQNRWDTILKQVGPTGMQTFCQRVLDSVTVQTLTTTVEASSTTAQAVAQVTDFVTIDKDVQVSTEVTETSTSFSTETVTVVGSLQKRAANDNVPAGMSNAFDALARDNKDWVVAQCKAAKFSPATLTETVVVVQTTPTVVATQTATETVVSETTRFNEIVSTNTVTVVEAATVTEVVTLPASTCPGYTSTGSVPWAIYSDLDMIGTPGQFQLFNNVGSREICTQMCQADSQCKAQTYKAAVNACFKVNAFTGFFPTSVNGFNVAMRGKTCAQTVSDGAPTGYNCCIQYRAS